MDANIEPFRIQSFNQSIVPWRVLVVKGGGDMERRPSLTPVLGDVEQTGQVYSLVSQFFL